MKEKKFNLNYLLSGSEGTLAIVGEAKLRLTPLPKYKFLSVVKYEFFNDALLDAEKLLGYDPVAIETIDEKVLSLAKTDEIVLVSGKLVPIGDVKEIQMPIGGIAKEIFVQEGDIVKKGDLLMYVNLEIQN